uniref:DUF19 domain-containing protein n=1 Tax=Thelazia callipaeda TaxID=103827 RepID=A0A0N5D2W6_THECL
MNVFQFCKSINLQENQNSSDTVTNSLGQAFTLPKIGKYVFRELCRLIREFNNCIYESRQQCPKHITISLIDASYGFLCSEGYETFMASADCLIDLDGRFPLKQCHEITLKNIEAANAHSGITIPTRFIKMCQAMDYFYNCVEKPIAESCGIAAWKMIIRVLHDTTKTLLPGCQFTVEPNLSFPLQSHPFASFPTASELPYRITTATAAYTIDNHLFVMNNVKLLSQEISNSKAEIIRSNDDEKDIIKQSHFERNDEENLRFVVSADDNANPTTDMANEQGHRSEIGISRHVFIDKDTDISYYDSGSSNSFMEDNSANDSYSYLSILECVSLLELCEE